MADKQEIFEMLERRANLLAQIELVNSEIKKQKDTILTPEIKLQLEIVDAEFQPIIDSAKDGLSKLEEEIKEAVLDYGETIKSDVCTVVYNRGRRTADLDELTKFINRYPGYDYLMKTGNPSVYFKDKSLV